MRAVFNKKKFNQLKKFLDENSEDLGQDDKNTYFFLLPKKIVKVVNNVSIKTVKIVIKLNRIGVGGNEAKEVEIPISQLEYVKKCSDYAIEMAKLGQVN